MTKEQFINTVNSLRKANKGKWYFLSATVEDQKYIEVKGFDTWLQVYRVNGINYSGLMDISVKDFLKTLDRPFNDLPIIEVTK